jgi:hypothetical protein
LGPGDGLHWSGSNNPGRNSLLRRSRRFEKEVSACRPDDHAADNGQRDRQTGGRSFLRRFTGAWEFLFDAIHAK